MLPKMGRMVPWILLQDVPRWSWSPAHPATPLPPPALWNGSGPTVLWTALWAPRPRVPVAMQSPYSLFPGQPEGKGWWWRGGKALEEWVSWAGSRGDPGLGPDLVAPCPHILPRIQKLIILISQVSSRARDQLYPSGLNCGEVAWSGLVSVTCRAQPWGHSLANPYTTSEEEREQMAINLVTRVAAWRHQLAGWVLHEWHMGEGLRVRSYPRCHPVQMGHYRETQQ